MNIQAVSAQLRDAMRENCLRQSHLKIRYHDDCLANGKCFKSKILSSSVVSRLLRGKPPGDGSNAPYYFNQVLDQIRPSISKAKADELEKLIAALGTEKAAIGSDDASPAREKTELQVPESEMLSHATILHFKLRFHPFQDDVRGPNDIYVSRSQKYIRESIYHAAKASGFIAVVGQSGSGKTTLKQDFCDRVARGHEHIVVIQPRIEQKKKLSAVHISNAIVCDLTSEKPVMNLEGKARQVRRILTGSSRAGNRHVLMIDEAHNLTIETLKDLKQFWEMDDGFNRLLGIVLIGQPELGEKLDERRNYEAREVIRRCEVATLEPLNGNLEEYLAFKFKRVDRNLADIFEDDAFDAIRKRLTMRHRTGGELLSELYPLSVHNVVIKAMNEAANTGFEKVCAEVIMGV